MKYDTQQLYLIPVCLLFIFQVSSLECSICSSRLVRHCRTWTQTLRRLQNSSRTLMWRSEMKMRASVTSARITPLLIQRLFCHHPPPHWHWLLPPWSPAVTRLYWVPHPLHCSLTPHSLLHHLDPQGLLSHLFPLKHLFHHSPQSQRMLVIYFLLLL